MLWYNHIKGGVQMKLFTIKEVAEITKRSEQGVRNLISKKGINAIKVLGSTRITQEELERITGIKYEEQKEVECMKLETQLAELEKEQLEAHLLMEKSSTTKEEWRELACKFIKLSSETSKIRRKLNSLS